MASDIVLNDNSVNVVGALGVNTDAPARTVHVVGGEVHSGGNAGGFSFSDRAKPDFVETPTNGERWVWYANQGSARLWNGKDVLTIDSTGRIQADVYGRIHPFVIFGRNVLGKPRVVAMYAQDLVLSHVKEGENLEAIHPEDTNFMTNYALSHMAGDTLVVNRNGNYKGGVQVEGAVTFTGTVNAGGLDLAAEVAALKKQVAALKAKVGLA